MEKQKMRYSELFYIIYLLIPALDALPLHQAIAGVCRGPLQTLAVPQNANSRKLIRTFYIHIEGERERGIISCRASNFLCLVAERSLTPQFACITDFLFALCA